ncbi:unnamed protein product [Arabis nemorensis]|uniref:Uncharacterized protein n=1 Tax=Arabis nemorensis TaxID=586526 RepID=A0A565BP66_9BRAS|nr:unnamed protein product [Arabis nemorensis]
MASESDAWTIKVEKFQRAIDVAEAVRATLGGRPREKVDVEKLLKSNPKLSKELDYINDGVSRRREIMEEPTVKVLDPNKNESNKL